MQITNLDLSHAAKSERIIGKFAPEVKITYGYINKSTITMTNNFYNFFFLMNRKINSLNHCCLTVLMIKVCLANYIVFFIIKHTVRYMQCKGTPGGGALILFSGDKLYR